MTNDIRRLILDEILKKTFLIKSGDHEAHSFSDLIHKTDGSNNIYYLAELNRHNEFAFTCHVASCSGGAYRCFGFGVVQSGGVDLELKTVKGIMNSQKTHEEFHFDIEFPGFPDNVNNFLIKAAKNAHKAFELKHDKNWAWYARDRIRKKKSS